MFVIIDDSTLMADGKKYKHIKQADKSDLSSLCKLSDMHILMYSGCYFQSCIDQKDLHFLYVKKEACGFVRYNQSPHYSLYQSLKIPEIQDLYVRPDKRGHNFGCDLIEYCEDLARQYGKKQIGLSVGLHKGFGPAQRLYAKLGYLPDGYGVTYDRRGVTANSIHPVDDNLCLMMIKSL